MHKSLPYIDIHTHSQANFSPENIAIINQFAADIDTSDAHRLFSVGLHPWHISEDTYEENLKNVRVAFLEPNVIAVGEAGLDRITATPFHLQLEAFTMQLVCAFGAGKPMIIHAVRAYPDVVEVYKKTGLNVTLIFHGFSGNLQTAKQLIKRGFFLSFGEALFDDRKKASDVFKEIPIGQIFLETDESKKSISEIYQRAAEIKSIGLENLKETIFQNFNTCFGGIL